MNAQVSQVHQNQNHDHKKLNLDHEKLKHKSDSKIIQHRRRVYPWSDQQFNGLRSSKSFSSMISISPSESESESTSASASVSASASTPPAASTSSEISSSTSDQGCYGTCSGDGDGDGNGSAPAPAQVQVQFCFEDLKRTFLDVGHLISNFFHGPTSGLSGSRGRGRSRRSSSRSRSKGRSRSRSRSKSLGRRGKSPAKSSDDKKKTRSRMTFTRSESNLSVFDDTANEFLNYWIGPRNINADADASENDDDDYDDDADDDEERQDKETARGGGGGESLNMRRVVSSTGRKTLALYREHSGKSLEGAGVGVAVGINKRTNSSSMDQRPNTLLKRGLSSKEKRRLKRYPSSSQRNMTYEDGRKTIAVVNYAQMF